MLGRRSLKFSFDVGFAVMAVTVVSGELYFSGFSNKENLMCVLRFHSH